MCFKTSLSYSKYALHFVIVFHFTGALPVFPLDCIMQLCKAGVCTNELQHRYIIYHDNQNDNYL